MKDSPQYDPTQKYNFKLMPIADQAHYHIRIVDHMKQLGMAGIPERVQNFAGDTEAGARALSTLHQRVREFMAGVNTKDLPASTDTKASSARAEKGKKTATRPAATGRSTAKPQSGTATQETDVMATKTAAKSNGSAEEKFGKFPLTAKIQLTATGKENPRREGTGPHKRYAVIMACNGQTVASFQKKKGQSDTLARAVREKLVTVK